MALKDKLRIRRLAFRRGIGLTLFFWFMGISLLPLTVVSVISYQNARQSLRTFSEKGLTQTITLKAEFIEKAFNEHLNSLDHLSGTESTHSLLSLLVANNTNLPIKEYVQSQTWNVLSQTYGSDLKHFQEINGYHDILLIDGKGNIIFSVKKEKDLGANIFEGGFAYTKLSKACQASFNQRGTTFADLEYYDPSGALACFLVQPVIKYDRVLGLLVFQIPMNGIDGLLTGSIGLGERGQTFLVGDDGFLRSGSTLEDSSDTLSERITSKVVEAWIKDRKNKTAARLLGGPRGTKAVESGRPAKASPGQGRDPVRTYIGRGGEKVLGTYRPIKSLERLGVGWALVAEVDAQWAFRQANELGSLVLGLVLVTASLVLIIAVFTTRRIVQPVRSLAWWAKSVAQGNLDEVHIKAPANELGSLRDNFAEMTRTLREARDESQRMDWINKGLAQLNERMLEGDGLTNLGRLVINHLAGYLGAAVGRIHVADEERRLIPLAGYAVKPKEGRERPILPGEGLVGEAFRLGQPISLKDIPVGYLDVNSGLGSGVANHLYIQPLIQGREVRGVVELATLREFGRDALEFLSRAAERIALSIDVNAAWEKTTQLLDQTRRQAEELQSQQEELRQTNEELEEQAKALRRSEESLQAQQEELRVTNEELEERTKSLEEQTEAVQKRNAELVVAQAEIEEKALALERASRYKSEFLANMSHELRTPLNSILILSQLLSADKDGNLSQKQKEFAETINTSGSDLLKLINEILDLSKVEAGRIELHPEELALAELAEAMRRTFGQVAEDKGLKFDIEISADAPETIVTDVLRLQQVVKNLLSNAFKFTAQGRVALTLSRPRAGDELAGLGLNPEKALALVVTDTGIGIAPDKQDLVFESFKQADGTTSRKYGGTGLGLAISRRLVELMGGLIRMESTEGAGTTFTVILPDAVVPTLRSQDQGPAPAEPEDGGGEAAGAKTGPATTEDIIDDRKNLGPEDRSILVIEDDPKFAKILIDLAAEKGFKGLIAGDGEAGLHFADYYRPSAIILDVTLPGMDGWEVMERLKENPKTRPIPVHFISSRDDSLEAMKMGAVGYLTKPATSEQLDLAFGRIEDLITREVKRILIVEDDPVQRESIKNLIAAGDVETVLAATGEEAHELLKRESFDCMIMDLGLEDISGLALLSRIRRDKKIPKFPVIVYTGKEISEAEEAELQRYAESIIIKDVRSPERLLAETTLFLHRVEADLPQEQRDMLKLVHSKESILSGKKILVVDDDMRNVFALSSILEEKGIGVIVGRNGREGVDKLVDNPETDLVLMDIMMPEMNGYEAMKEIRKKAEFKDLPIIALTAKAMRGDRKKCIDAGASDYLAKPVDTAKLISLLRVWLYK